MFPSAPIQFHHSHTELSALPAVIISGGQTGVDRGALDAALEWGHACGGWCPAGRRAEDGAIPSRYPMWEHSKSGYRARTLRNLLDADGTLILYKDQLAGGTLLTVQKCLEFRRPCKLIDSSVVTAQSAGRLAWEFAHRYQIRTLNVAGPSLSHWGEGQAYAREAVAHLIAAGREAAAQGILL